MRKLIIILLFSSLMLAGCSDMANLEDQAYVLVLGADISDGGMIELSIQIPKLGSSGESQSGGNSGKDSSYLIISAKGKSYQDALEALKWSATRELNLSQIKMIVVSEALSKSSAFSPVVTAIAETYHLYTASRFVICEGSASEFISGHETVLGAQLSDELDAMFDHYTELGCIPSANFADVYYAMRSIYSDPMVIWGFPSPESKTDDKPAAAMLGSDAEMKSMTKTPSSRHYLGSVVIKDGMFAEKLNAHHTLFANLIAGNISTFSYDLNGQTYQLAALERPRTKVTIYEGRAKISIKLRLSAIAQNSSLERNDVAPAIKQDIIDTIAHCQNIGIEPFGFAGKAASNFLTIDRWRAFDWHKCFSNADKEVSVQVMRADS